MLATFDGAVHLAEGCIAPTTSSHTPSSLLSHALRSLLAMPSDIMIVT